jgi:hypothetical protein
MFKNIARLLTAPSAVELERSYLEGAGDRYELEYREREISRGKFRNHRRACGF